MMAWKQSGRLAQAFAATGNSGTYRPKRRIHDRCGFGVLHPVQPDEQKHSPLLGRKCGERAFQLAKLEVRVLIRRKRHFQIEFLRLEIIVLPRIAAQVGDVLAV